MKTLPQHRRDVIEICRRIHARGWISAADGNISVRVAGDRLLTFLGLRLVKAKQGGEE